MTVDNLTELQKVELNLANKFVELCKQNQLRYYMIGGTFLGAVRHKGFIPWDDDMDFGMPREDYQQLLEYLKRGNSELRVEHFSVGSEFKYSFMKIVDDSVMLEIHNGEEVQVVPSWIDIFPLDFLPTNTVKRKIHILRILMLRAEISMSNIDRINLEKKNRPVRERVFIWLEKNFKISHFLNLNSLYVKLDRTLAKYPEKGAAFWMNIMGSYKDKEIFPANIFKQTHSYTFENQSWIGPLNYDFYLKKLYGDYLKVPDKNDRNHHHTKVLKN